MQIAAGTSFPHAGEDGPVVVMVRPEAMGVGEDDGDVALAGQVEDMVFLGPMCAVQWCSTTVIG